MFEHRNLYMMILLSIITVGLYFFYWAYKTAKELRAQGNEIPTVFLAIIPLAHFYFWYRYSEAFCKSVLKTADHISYFLLLSLLPHIGMLIVQSKLNDIAAS